MWYSYLMDFIHKIETNQKDFNTFFKNNWVSLKWKGYGTQEMEMKFLHKVFLSIQAKQPTFKSFSWDQSSAYNDNYNHFQLQNFLVNDDYMADNHSLDFYFAYHEEEIKEYSAVVHIQHKEYPDPEEIEFAKNNGLEFEEDCLVSEKDWDKFYEYQKKKHEHLELPCLQMFALLKLLEINFSMYYFLYTFGAEVCVRFDKEGVTIQKVNYQDIEGGGPLHIEY